MTEQKICDIFEKMAKRFDSSSIPHVSEKFRVCAKLLQSEHKFWETMPIMNLRRKDDKKGQMV